MARLWPLGHCGAQFTFCFILQISFSFTNGPNCVTEFLKNSDIPETVSTRYSTMNRVMLKETLSTHSLKTFALMHHSKEIDSEYFCMSRLFRSGRLPHIQLKKHPPLTSRVFCSTMFGGIESIKSKKRHLMFKGWQFWVWYRFRFLKSSLVSFSKNTF